MLAIKLDPYIHQFKRPLWDLADNDNRYLTHGLEMSDTVLNQIDHHYEFCSKVQTLEDMAGKAANMR